jgi:hypothetical protein
VAAVEGVVLGLGDLFESAAEVEARAQAGLVQGMGAESAKSSLKMPGPGLKRARRWVKLGESAGPAIRVRAGTLVSNRVTSASGRSARWVISVLRRILPPRDLR